MGGLSWEGAFAQAEEGLGDKFPDGGHHTLAVVALSLSMCSVVLPAWALYILPRSQQDEDEVELNLGTLSRSASCPARLDRMSKSSPGGLKSSQTLTYCLHS